MPLNPLKKYRESLMISKADVSPMTISRIESGQPCRIETQRKILQALGIEISEKEKISPKEMTLPSTHLNLPFQNAKKKR